MKQSMKERLENASEFADVLIWTFISKGTHQISLKLPKKTDDHNPKFGKINYSEMTFEVKKFTTEYPKLFSRVDSKEIYWAAMGASEDKITATFNFENIEILDFASNPMLDVDLIRNPFDMDGTLPYLEILVVHLKTPLQFYLPVKGNKTFGKHSIPLFTNPVSPPTE